MALIFSLVAVFLLTLDNTDLIHSHEARAAQNAQRMLTTGEWGLLRLYDGRLDLQKPPAYYWCVALLSYWLSNGQVTVWTTRLPAALMGIGCVALLYAFMRANGRRRGAIIAAVTLATAIHFTAISRTARIDIPLTTMVLAAVVSFYYGCRVAVASTGWAYLPWHVGAGLCMGVAALLKGPVGPALIAAAAGLWWLTAWRRLPALSWLVIPGVAGGVALPWFLWANQVTTGELFRVFILHHTLARFSGTSPQLAVHPWWFYLPRFCLDFLPWSPLVGYLAAYGTAQRLWKTDTLLQLAVAGFAGIFLLLSTAQFKRADYLLPAYPFAALLVGCAGDDWLRRHAGSWQQWGWRLFQSMAGLTLCGWVINISIIEPQSHDGTDKANFAALVRQQAPAPQTIIQFRLEDHLLSFRLGLPLETLVEWVDLRNRLEAPGPHYVLMPKEYVYPAMQIITGKRWSVRAESPVWSMRRASTYSYVLLCVE
ncbi:MAG: glycosyltransferase family 39 protein [Gemmataceae bacterium]|nr:glycosyltransferase family 39 protein [Gemmataceae bacterium]MDW8243762.1 glycosyltransferase family 39 protein [Thermogemmata sp.]